MKDHETFSARLTNERHKRGLSQAQLAEEIGVETKTVGRWEQNETLPRMQYRKKLSDFFGKTLNELGLFEEDKAEALVDDVSWERNRDQRIRAVLAENALVDHTYLFGADKLIANIGDQLKTTSGSWLISLFGEGGVGKTALAYEIVSRYAAPSGFTRVAWVSAKSLHISRDGLLLKDSSAELRWVNLVKKMADQLGIHLGHNSAEWVKDFQDGMLLLPAHEKCLLVIDNLEMIEDVIKAIYYLCRSQIIKPHKILVTTRYALLGRLHSVVEKQINEFDTQAAQDFIRSLGNRDIDQASDKELEPIISVTEGNPLLIKLFVTQLLTRRLPLSIVLKELQMIDEQFGKNIFDYLYAQSLLSLEKQAGKNNAHRLMNAFRPLHIGEAIDYEILFKSSRIEERETFHHTLRAACDLALVRTSKINAKYSIHHLLWNFVCSVDG